MHLLTEPAGSQEVDLFGESLIGDLGDSPTPSPPKCTVNNRSSDVDLFGGADFVSASPQLEVGGNSQTQVGCLLTGFIRSLLDIKPM